MHRSNNLCLALALLLAPSDTTAQSKGSVEGDVFLLMQDGDTKKGSGISVVLLPDTASFASRRVEICQQWELRDKAVDREGDSLKLLFDQAIAKKRLSAAESIMTVRFSTERLTAHNRAADTLIMALINSVRLSETSAGLDAHFKFEGLTEGNYALIARWPISGMPYSWFVAFRVTAGERKLQNLDNSVESLSNNHSFVTRFCRTIVSR